MSRVSRLFGAGPRLATRIALIIILPLIAIQIINFGMFLLLPRATIHLYRSEWVLAVSERITREVFEAPPHRRQAILAAVPERQWLDLSWQSSSPREPGNDFAIPELRRLEAALMGKLGPLARSASIIPIGRHPPRSMSAHVEMVPPEETPIADDGSGVRVEYRSSIPDIFGLAIEGNDGTWLSIRPRREDDTLRRVIPFIAGLVLSGALIALLSITAARRIMQRMEKMAAAAERLGRERETTPISEAGLGEFAVIARSLNEMQARIKRFVDERTRMVAAISHDLRTPLTRMKLSAEYIGEPDLKQDITDGIDRMRSMIEATLAFASHDARGEAHQKIDLAALLISLVDEMSDLGHALRYEGPDHCLFSCQPQMMRRAITNLLDNAVKFAPSAVVTLTESVKTISLSIIDTGPGIPAHRLTSVLEPFNRLETSRNEETGGFGLGLSIANDIILAHGGEMKLSNDQPCGLRVEIVLPALGSAEKA